MPVSLNTPTHTHTHSPGRLTGAEPRKTARISCSVMGWLVASGLALEAGVRMELMYTSMRGSSWVWRGVDVSHSCR